jgi:hypothetical protein
LGKINVVKRLLSIPENLNPPVGCVQIRVPNDSFWRALFWGALDQLQLWNSYERDPEHKAKIVADKWKAILNAAFDSDCAEIVFGGDMQLRQNGCLLEFSLDCVNWFTLYDPRDCIQEIAGQPGSSGLLAPGECREWDAVLAGDGYWYLPVPVSDGYTVEVTSPSGFTSDGTTGLVQTFYCANGAAFLLGTCVSGFYPLDPSDPIPTAEHHALLSRIETGGSPVWFESLSGIQTVTGGVNNATLWFQVNDSDLLDNGGKIAFHVKVCAPTNEGCLLVASGSGVVATPLGGGRYQVYVPVNDSAGGVDFANGGIEFKDGATPCCKIYRFVSLSGWTNNNDDVSNQGAAQECDGTNHVFEGVFTGENWIQHYQAQGYELVCMRGLNIKSLTAFTVVFDAFDCSA